MTHTVSEIVYDSNGTAVICTQVHEGTEEDGKKFRDETKEVFRIVDDSGKPNAVQLQQLLYFVTNLCYDNYGKDNPAVVLRK